MQALRNHIVLIGFKHVGKSVIGNSLARKLCVPFIDSDKVIESLYKNESNKAYTCRQIMQHNGENCFRHLEKTALAQIIDAKPCVISLGGGTPLYTENQSMIKSSILIHLTAPRGIVFERILMAGRPAFYNQDEDLLGSFNRLWDEREKIYENIRNFLIINNGSIDDTVNKIMRKINILEAI